MPLTGHDEPMAQASHTTCPGEAASVPGAHGIAALNPVVLQIDPTGQTVQLTAPEVAANVPALH